MIKFALGCDKEHEFEGWFGSNEEFTRLQKRGLVDCPICNSTKINKLLMAPAIPKKSNSVADNIVPCEPNDGDAGTNINVDELAKNEIIEQPTNSVVAGSGAIKPGQKIDNAPTTAAAIPELPPQLADAHAQMIEKVREFKKHVIENTEDVGSNFVEEARKIHFGETEKRGIHGKADIQEAIELAEEGIDVMPIPELPEEKN